MKMKTTIITGQYVNIVVNDYIDIFIILPEWADELTVEDVEDISTRATEVLNEFFKKVGNFYLRSQLREVLQEEFEDDEYQVLIQVL